MLPGSQAAPTRMADTFLCGWAHTQTQLLRSAMWRMRITSHQVKHSSEREPSNESAAAQFSRDAITLSPAQITGLPGGFCGGKKIHKKVQLGKIKVNVQNIVSTSPYISIYMLFQKVLPTVCLLLLQLAWTSNYYLSLHRGAFLAAKSNWRVSGVLAE